MAFRAFYALPAEGFRTSTGQHTNAVYGFVSMLARLLESEAPTHVAVAFDVSRHSFRTELYPAYKGTREATPEEFTGQVDLITQVLKTVGIPALTREGYEADDLLATLAFQGAEQGWNVLVVSGDRDTFQTVTDRVTVLYPGASPGDLRRMTPAAIEEKYGVPPQRYPEIAALVGETSDNLPGVPGVGPKTAAQWITKFDGLDNLLEQAEKVGGKRGQALRDHIEDVRRNRRLNRLVTDVKLDVTLEELTCGRVDVPAVHSLFDTLEIGALRSRLLSAVAALREAAGDVEAEQQETVEDEPLEITVTSREDQIRQWAFEPLGAVALRIEGDVSPAHPSLKRIILARAGHALVVDDPASLDAGAEAALLALITGAQDVTMANWKGGWHACHCIGWELPRASFDVRLAAYLAHPELRSYGTADLVKRYLGHDLGEAEEHESDALFDMADDGSDEPTPSHVRSARLTAALIPLRAQLEDVLTQSDSLSVLTGIEMPVSECLARMERIGIACDVNEFETQSRALGADVELARRQAYAVIGREVNLSSPKQLQQVLFEELSLPRTKRTKTGWTTNAEALQELLARLPQGQESAGREFLSNLLAHRDRIKLKQMVDSLLGCLGDDGRIHTTFSQTAAATGRLASSEPNLQNIPARTPDGLRIRRGFVAGSGCEALMSADYSQIEMRIMAHLSGDAGLIEAFNSGEDLHRTMAAMVFDTDVEDVTSEQRSRIKATSYGLAYGLSSYGLSAQLHIPVGEAAALRERYFERFGGVHDYLASIVDQARADGWTQTMFGRRRYLPDLTSTNRQRREMAERAALNAPIQGSAADIIKVAMIEVDRRLEESSLSSRMLLQIHDELLLEIAHGEQEEVEALVREAMASPVTMAVPLEVAVGIGTDWMAAAH